MSKKIIFDNDGYTDMPPDVEEAFDRSVRIADFLPPPEVLAKASVKKTVTIRIDGDNLDFFKQEADKHGTHYQTMINDLLSEYVSRHKQAV